MVFRIFELGSLETSDDNKDVLLPKGFKIRTIAISDSLVGNTDYKWHSAPDGGEVFESNNGEWIYVSNSEVHYNRGGASAILFNKDGSIKDAYQICDNTSRNCAGGKTPWNTLQSCEEHREGYVWECFPFDKNKKPVKLTSLGKFMHEAACIDNLSGYIYLTEDESDGLLY